jgi:hypothetical protein
MRRLLMATTLLLGFAAGAGAQDSLPTTEPWTGFRFSGTEDPRLVAALFRYTFVVAERHHARVFPISTYFVGLGLPATAHDPTSEVIRLIGPARRIVRPRSEAAMGDSTLPCGIADRSTQRCAMLVSIFSLHPVTKDSLLAYTSYLASGLSGATFRCYATRRRSQWVVRRCDTIGVS